LTSPTNVDTRRTGGALGFADPDAGIAFGIALVVRILAGR
jgi:hypothetical protein